MCGIAGARSKERALSILEKMGHRGSNPKVVEKDGYWIAARTHSMVGDVKQPVESEETVGALNGEIYNWKDISRSMSIEPENDSEMLFRLLDNKENLTNALNMLDGIYAAVKISEETVSLFRDVLGVNPLWYTKNPFAFASEKSALEDEGRVHELNPRRIAHYNTRSETLEFRTRDFLTAREETCSRNQVKQKLVEAVRKRIPDQGRIALLFSGGIDSVLLAAILQYLDADFTCYVAGTQPGNTSTPRDVEAAKKAASAMDLDLKVVIKDLSEIRRRESQIADRISTTNPVKLSVALTLDAAMSGNERCVISGLGSEQIFGGYERESIENTNNSIQNLKRMYQRDLYRDNVVGFLNNKELRLPFLDHGLIEAALSLPKDEKSTDKSSKVAVREIAKDLGVPKKLAERKKLAAQYGSNMTKALRRLSDKGLENHARTLRDRPNNRVACLSSGGKDSVAAMHRMKRRNNKIQTVITMTPENPDSYMFDPENSAVRDQCSKMDVPLIEAETDGRKENELKDLQKALRKAAEQHNVDSICSGAIQSNYQRRRIRRLADKTGLRSYSPLWGWNAKNYMRWLANTDLTVRIVDVAARGLDEQWIGRKLGPDAVEELISLSETHGFHPAGEGGGYETEVTGLTEELKAQ